MKSSLRSWIKRFQRKAASYLRKVSVIGQPRKRGEPKLIDNRSQEEEEPKKTFAVGHSCSNFKE